MATSSPSSIPISDATATLNSSKNKKQPDEVISKSKTEDTLSKNEETDTSSPFLGIDILKRVKNASVSIMQGKMTLSLVDILPRMIPTGKNMDVGITRTALTGSKLNLSSQEQELNFISILMANHITIPYDMVSFQFLLSGMPLYVLQQLRNLKDGISLKIMEPLQEFSIPNYQAYFPPLRMEPQIDSKTGLLEMLPIPERAQQVLVELQMIQQLMASKFKELVDMRVSRQVLQGYLPMAAQTEATLQITLTQLLQFFKHYLNNVDQPELQELSRAMMTIVTDLIPATMQSFLILELDVVTLNLQEKNWLKLMAENIQFPTTIKFINEINGLKFPNQNIMIQFMVKLEKMGLITKDILEENKSATETVPEKEEKEDAEENIPELEQDDMIASTNANNIVESTDDEETVQDNTHNNDYEGENSISKDKKSVIESILKNIKEAAADCHLNYEHNQLEK
jgi:thymidylate synthase ThyX